MKLSIAICTNNERDYIGNLLESLVKFILSPVSGTTGHEYEIVVLDDNSDYDIWDIFKAYEKSHPELFRWYRQRMQRDFATHKNVLNNLCRGEWILNLDADETIPVDLLFNIPEIVRSNPDVDAYWFPRINTVDGLTLEHVRKWRWIITTLDGHRTVKALDPSSDEYRLLKEYDLILNEESGFVTFNQPIINWPDPQMRLYKNSPSIKWEGKVHERLVGMQNYTHFPMEPDFAIRHYKDIKRQEKQNKLYDTIQR